MSSVGLLVTICILSTIQLFGFGLQFPLVTALIARGMYLGRLFGLNLSFKYSVCVEGAGFFWLIVRPILLQRDFKWSEFIFYLVIFIVVTIIEAYNEEFYVYEEITEEEYQQHLYNTKVLGDESNVRVKNKKGKVNKRSKDNIRKNVNNGRRVRR